MVFYYLTIKLKKILSTCLLKSPHNLGNTVVKEKWSGLRALVKEERKRAE